MKNFSISRLLASIVLIATASTFLSFAFTGDPGKYAVEISAVLFAIGFVKGLVQELLRIELFHLTGVLYDGFVINDTTYAGEAASSFIVKAITGNDTVRGGHVYVKDGIKSKFTIPRFDANYEDLIQDRAATPTSKGTFTVDGRALTPKDYMIYTEFNPRDYEAHWFATQLNATLIDRRLPATVESIVIQEVMKRHDKFLNKLLWNADTTLSTIYKYFDGYIKKATGSGSTLVAGSPTTLTATNIQAEMLKGYNLIPDPLKYDASMKFFMNYGTSDLYAQSQINQTYKGIDTTTNGIMKFRGLDIVRIADLPNNFYFIAKGMATPESNLWVGMNSTDDAQLELKQMQANSELWFIKMNMKVDVQIGWNEETVLYNGN